MWLKQLEQVLAESEQMRKEADDIGPRAELDHWKKRMSRFNYLLDQIKGPNVKAVLGVLHTSQSKLIKVSKSRSYKNGSFLEVQCWIKLYCKIIESLASNHFNWAHSSIQFYSLGLLKKSVNAKLTELGILLTGMAGTGQTYHRLS